MIIRILQKISSLPALLSRYFLIMIILPQIKPVHITIIDIEPAGFPANNPDQGSIVLLPTIRKVDAGIKHSVKLRV